ncbi:MAG: aminoglycoside resistance protein [Marmoricola sp.]|nr:aminoglycoside resistance protein [Marmoricola sp.]
MSVSTLADLCEEWDLQPDGAVMHGSTAVVLPVLTRTGKAAVLKVGQRHPESELEHLALTRWDGDGAVRLLRADPHRGALLLERLSAVSLSDAWDLEACTVVAGLYPHLHRGVGAPFARLSEYLAPSIDRLATLPRNASVPRRLVEQAVALGRDFITDEQTDGILVHTDLHYDNVLADNAGEWVAIDPKPLSGDPHYEVAPMLWNRVAELEGDLRNGVRRRFHTLVDAAGFDEDRARDWVVVRMVVNALEDRDADWLTTCIAVAKAIQE